MFTDHDMMTTFRAEDGLGVGDFEQALQHLMRRAHGFASAAMQSYARLEYDNCSCRWIIVSHRTTMAKGRDMESLAIELLDRYDPEEAPESRFWKCVEAEAARQVEGAMRVGQWRTDPVAVLAETPDRVQWFRDSDGETTVESVVMFDAPANVSDDVELEFPAQGGLKAHRHIETLDNASEGDRFRGVWD